MSEFKRGQNPDLEEDEQNAEFEARSFEPKISDEDFDAKIDLQEGVAPVEASAHESEPDSEQNIESVTFSEPDHLNKIIEKYGEGDWQNTYDDGAAEYRFNKLEGVMEQEMATGEIINVTESIKTGGNEKYSSLHQESLQAFNEGQVYLMKSEKITDNGVTLEILAQWVEADGRIRSVSWSREVAVPELPTVEGGSDDEGGDSQDEIANVEEGAVLDESAVDTKENSAVEVVIEMGADWEDGDEADGGFDEEDNSVQGFGFQTQSAKPVEITAQTDILKSIDTSQARPVESTNFHEAAGVLDGAVVSNELAKDIEVVASEQKDAGELAPESKVDQANSFVENINLFSESAIAIESANVAVNFETTEATTESDDFAEVAVVEETVAEPAPVETGGLVIDMGELWGEAEVSDEPYQVGSELNTAEQFSNAVSEQVVAVREYATASEPVVGSIKQAESVVEQANTVPEQADINFVNEQITSAEPAKVFVQPVEVAAQSTEAVPAYEVVQETGSVIQMFEYQKENSFELNQEKDVELSSPEQIISTIEEVQVVESAKNVSIQEVAAETPATETATVINLADYWGKGDDAKIDNTLNIVEPSNAVLPEQKITTIEPSVVVESVQFVAEAEPSKAVVEQDGSEPVVVQAANVIDMATYRRENAEAEQISFTPDSKAATSRPNEQQLNMFSSSYAPVTDEVFVQDVTARDVELIQQAA